MQPQTSRTRLPRACAEGGMALITVIMVMTLVSVLMLGFVSAIVADNRSSGLDHDQTQAYAVTHAGLEKLTSDLSGLFVSDFSPSTSQINALLVNRPTVYGFQYLEPDGSSGYKITWDFVDGSGNPAPESAAGSTITHGPYQGFKGLITPYNITVTSRSNGGAEVRMKRTLQTIAVPVFQFGLFSENDLSFHAGPDFNFGGRVHTNANLYLAQGNGTTLTLSDRVTAVAEVIRTNLSNGWDTTTNYTGTVRVPTTIMANPVNNVYRNLARTEGSLIGTVGSGPTVGPPSWTTLSIGTYNSNVRNGTTGAKRLDLPLVSQGAVPVDILRRPAQNSNESATAPLIYQQRYYSQAALRILLSDTLADLTSLPTATVPAPVPLDGAVATAAQYGPAGTAIPNAGGVSPPMAASPGPLAALTTSAAAAAAATTLSVAAVPAALRPPVLFVNGLPAGGITCTGRTPTTFTGCAGGVLAAAIGSTVTASVPSGAGTTMVTTTLTAAIVLGAVTLPVVSTASFAPGLFWVNLAPPLAVSCTGNTTTSFTGCTGITVAVAMGTTISTNALSNAGTPLLNGFIKIEKQAAGGAWTDVTTEILNLGISNRNQRGTLCADPNPNAVLRLQRLRDNAGGVCYYGSSLNVNDYWPNALYDTREGLQRDSIATGSATIAMGGVMHYVALDINNLKRWFAGTIGTTGNTAKNDNGYIVYFSDRRNNRNAAATPVETGEYGFEDVINPLDVNGVPNGTLQTGEDSGGLDGAGKPMRDGNGVLETYGQTPQNLPAGFTLPYTAAARPHLTAVGGVNITAAHAMVNRPILFRRALKLINAGIVGGVTSLPPGLTVASENPVYVHGNYNAIETDTLANPHVPAAVIGDAVTLLSRNWVDAQSFLTPNNPGARTAVTTGYRMAIIAGKNPAFPRPTAWASAQDFGTDGGAHNFLRYLENWGGSTLNYRGSIVSFYFARQATGAYKCCTNVYGPPTRGYNFNLEFLTPSLLPPGTPMFRDINTLTFRQLLRPNQ